MLQAPSHVLRLARALTVAFTVVLPAHLHAQSLAQQTRGLAAADSTPRHVLSINPFLPFWGYFQGEYETMVSKTLAVGIAASHIAPFDDRYTNVDAKLHLYPSERGLAGFNVAASVGAANIRSQNQDCIYSPQGVQLSCTSPAAFTAGAIGLELGYQWLLGPERKYAVAGGFGVKRYLAASSKFQNVSQVMPTLRLTVGYAF